MRGSTLREREIRVIREFRGGRHFAGDGADDDLRQQDGAQEQSGRGRAEGHCRGVCVELDIRIQLIEMRQG